MGAWIAAALLAAPLNLSLGAHLDGSASSDPANDAVARNGTLSGLVALSGTYERALLSASYTPTLRLTDQVGSSTAFLNSASLGASGKSGRFTLAASASGSLGRQDFSPVSQAQVASPGAPPPPPIDRLPDKRFVTIGAAGGQVVLGYQSSTRLQLGASASAGTSGELTADLQKTLPRQNSAALSTSARWLANPLDTLSGSLSSSLGTTAATADSGSVRTTTLAGELSWARRIAPTTSGKLGIGAAAVHSVGGPALQTSALPTFSASLAHAVPLRAQALTLSLSASSQPLIDARSGLGYIQGTAAAAVAFSPLPWLSFSGSASGARPLSGPFTDQWGAVGELSAGLRLKKNTSLGIGFREARVITSVASVATPGAAQSSLQWSAFAGLSTGLQKAF